MKTAAQILRKKQFIKDIIDKRLPRSQSDELWEKARIRLDGILRRYADLPEGYRLHTHKRIFPSAAIYLTLKDEIGQEFAFSVIEDAAVELTTRLGGKLAGLLRLPGCRGLFIGIWNPLTKKLFGSDRGFKNVFYPKKKGEYRMDIVACPYCRFFAELGCPELTRVFCENDDRMYGSLPGIQFRRTGTLGKGADRCDFYIKKVKDSR